MKFNLKTCCASHAMHALSPRTVSFICLENIGKWNGFVFLIRPPLGKYILKKVRMLLKCMGANKSSINLVYLHLLFIAASHMILKS